MGNAKRSEQNHSRRGRQPTAENAALTQSLGGATAFFVPQLRSSKASCQNKGVFAAD